MIPKQFRILIGCYLACVVLAILGHVFTAEQLPVPLRDFVKAAEQTTWMVSWVGVAYLVAATGSTIGLIIFKPWARPSFAGGGVWCHAVGRPYRLSSLGVSVHQS